MYFTDINDLNQGNNYQDGTASYELSGLSIERLAESGTLLSVQRTSDDPDGHVYSSEKVEWEVWSEDEADWEIVGTENTLEIIDEFDQKDIKFTVEYAILKDGLRNSPPRRCS